MQQLIENFIENSMPKIDLDNLFKNHPPKGDQVARYAEIRNAAQSFAQIIVEYTPESAEQTLAIRKVHDAMMQANAAIACNESVDSLPYQKQHQEHRKNPEKEHYPIG